MGLLWLMVFALILLATYATEFSVHGEVSMWVAVAVLAAIPTLAVLIGYYVFVI